ncbi:MAG: hypothetical protein ACI8XO_004908 [Verrucomicrobiales bacterium]|jgi:hypothetical protein
MILKRLVITKLLAASTFGLYLFDYRKAWAEEIPAPQPPVPLVQPAELPSE